MGWERNSGQPRLFNPCDGRYGVGIPMSSVSAPVAERHSLSTGSYPSHHVVHIPSESTLRLAHLPRDNNVRIRSRSSDKSSSRLWSLSLGTVGRSRTPSRRRGRRRRVARAGGKWTGRVRGRRGMMSATRASRRGMGMYSCWEGRTRAEVGAGEGPSERGGKGVWRTGQLVRGADCRRDCTRTCTASESSPTIKWHMLGLFAVRGRWRGC
ncbi:hypothetical protein C8F01DRAFT_368996 [Mycena amicta]|nr:hypothetical protein C8F01DRAFT_368996 [Mycena amicta]